MFNRAEANFPTMTLELRIAPLIKTMVQEMLLNEEECKMEIESAVASAVGSFDWRKQIQQEVQRTLNVEINGLVKRLVDNLLYDPEVKTLFKKAVIKGLEKSDPFA
jgi:hypothetical protein